MILSWLKKKNTNKPSKVAVERPNPPLLFQEQKEMLVWRLMEELRKMLLEESASCKKHYVVCPYPGTKNEAMLWVEANGQDSSYLRLSTRVVRRGTDLCVMNYMFKGALDEMSTYLANKEKIPELLASLQHLSDSIDDRN